MRCAVSAARCGSASFFQSSGESCEGVLASNIQDRPLHERLVPEGDGQLAQVPTLSIKREAAGNRIHRTLGRSDSHFSAIVIAELASPIEALSKLVVTIDPVVHRASARHSFLIADDHQRLALFEPLANAIDDLRSEFSFRHSLSSKLVTGAA
jgi:hypothetical protein